MWARIKPPSWGRCGAAAVRQTRFSFARERFVSLPRAVRSSTKTRTTYYDVLGVEPTASADDIKSAFRRQAKLVHPDVSKSADSEEDFKQLKEAYDVLSDAEQRAEYDEALQRAARRRSSAAAGSSGRRVVIIQDDPWGLGGATVVVEDFGDDDSDSDDDDDDDDDGLLDELQYMAWAGTPGNLRSSFQSSWQANARKQRRARQQQQQRAAMQAKLSPEDKSLLLREMPPQIRAAAQQVFGARLQSLNNLEELAELIDAVEEMEAGGVEFEFVDEGVAGGRSATRGSRRQGSGGSRPQRPGRGGRTSGGRRRRT